MELLIAVTMMAGLAVVAIPGATGRTDAVTVAARQFRDDLSLARSLAIVHNAACDVTPTSDGYAVSSSDPELAAELADMAARQLQRLSYARQFAFASASDVTVRELFGPISGPATSITFTPEGGLSSRVDDAVFIVGTDDHRATVIVCVQTGSVQIGPLTNGGGA